MRPLAILAPSLLLALAVSGSSFAEGERYTLEKSATGYVRMDTQTGEMSICEERDGQLICKLAADERSAFQDEIDRMQASIKSLEERVVKLENSLASRLESALPTEEDFDRTLSFMERFFRSFIDIVKDAEEGDGKDSSPDPQKT
jgi:flagellar motility protein MotE (MotC chaperone)